MKTIFLLILFFYYSPNIKPVITNCRTDSGKVIWPSEKGTTTWPIMITKDKIYFQQMRSKKDGYGVETNIFSRFKE